MCSIGCCVFREDLTFESIKFLTDLVFVSERRGYDGFGAYHILNGKIVGKYKFAGKSSEAIHKPEWDNFVKDITKGSVVIWNCRAQPLPEEIVDEDNLDLTVQPFEENSIIVSHNGTIPNDKELLKYYGLKKPEFWIDSKVFSLLYRYFRDEYGSNTNPIGVWKEVLSEIEGGFSTIVYDLKNSNELWLMKNFKPMTIAYLERLKMFIVVSEKEFLFEVLGYKPSPLDDCHYEWVEPYTLLKYNILENVVSRYDINTKSSAIGYSLPKPKENLALVMCSGGIDSVTSAYVAVKLHHKKVVLVNFNYGQLSAEKEWEAVQATAKDLKCKSIRIDLTWLGKLGKSPLTDAKIPLPQGISSVESVRCWVPARNLVMLSSLAAISETYGAKYVYTGWNLEESGSYPDNDIEALRLMNTIFDYFTQNRVKLKMVLERLMKPEILLLGNSLGLDYSKTWSCDLGHEKPDGLCGCCWARKHAFLRTGLFDLQTYEVDEISEPAPWIANTKFSRDIDEIMEKLK